jgi:hypothetical protein
MSVKRSGRDLGSIVLIARRTLFSLDLPRNGIVTSGQVIEATAEGFNMAPGRSTENNQCRVSPN